MDRHSVVVFVPMSAGHIKRCLGDLLAHIRSQAGDTSWHHILVSTQRVLREEAARELVAALRSWPGSGEFDGVQRHFGRSSHFLTHDELAEWMILRSHVTSVEAAYADLVKYAEDTSYPVLYTLLIGGLPPVRPLEVAEGVRLIPYRPEFFADLGHLDEEAVESALQREEVRSISSALVVRTLHPKVITPLGQNGVAAEAAEIDTAIYERLNGVRLMCGLITVSDVPNAGYHAVIDPSVPCYLRASYASYGLLGPIFSRGYVDDEFATRARSLCGAFEGLSQSKRRQLVIPLERLQSAIHEQYKEVDSAIDLGIALESLFLEDTDSSELAYKLSLRGARLLGTSTPDRKATRRLFKAIYTARSRAVHRGKLDVKRDSLAGRSTPRELLRDGFAVTADAARKIIQLGGIDWADFDLN